MGKYRLIIIKIWGSYKWNYCTAINHRMKVTYQYY